jgi:DNA-directed RNA polymerase specialized sigma24 family protein
MTIRLSKAACEGVRALFEWGAMGTWTDSQLITQFLSGQEGSEPAFRVLIHRHGPMVLGICQRVLRDEHAAEDAFQATFLILVKKASGLRDRALLSNWLYGVAELLARRTLARTAWGMRWPIFPCAFQSGLPVRAATLASVMVVCGAIAVAGVGVYRGQGSGVPPSTIDMSAALTPTVEPTAKPNAPPSNSSADASATTAILQEAIAKVRKVSDAPPKPTRSPSAIAVPLTGISIDGRLNDWPKGMVHYPIPNQFIGHPNYDSTLRDPDDEPPAYFMAGYDRKTELIYLAVVVNDREVQTHPTDVRATDAVEIYIDGAMSRRTIPEPAGDWGEMLKAAAMPALQYAAVPEETEAYGDSEGANPSLVYGKISRTTTRMKYHRSNNVITYEWAVQAFDRYPDQASRLHPGKRIGLEVAVLDEDPGRKRSAFFTWGPPPHVLKGFDAGTLGELILAED